MIHIQEATITITTITIAMTITITITITIIFLRECASHANGGYNPNARGHHRRSLQWKTAPAARGMS
jgi:hypothetical protein